MSFKAEKEIEAKKRAKAEIEAKKRAEAEIEAKKRAKAEIEAKKRAEAEKEAEKEAEEKTLLAIKTKDANVLDELSYSNEGAVIDAVIGNVKTRSEALERIMDRFITSISTDGKNDWAEFYFDDSDEQIHFGGLINHKNSTEKMFCALLEYQIGVCGMDFCVDDLVKSRFANLEMKIALLRMCYGEKSTRSIANTLLRHKGIAKWQKMEIENIIYEKEAHHWW